jgi:rubredoxin
VLLFLSFLERFANTREKEGFEPLNLSFLREFRAVPSNWCCFFFVFFGTVGAANTREKEGFEPLNLSFLREFRAVPSNWRCFFCLFWNGLRTREKKKGLSL